MKEGDQLRYGCINAHDRIGVPVEMAASEVKGEKGAGFVNQNGSGYMEYLDDQDTGEIFGHVEAPAETTSSTAGQTRYNCIVDPSAVFKILVDTGTFAITDIGDVCDVGVTGNVMGAYLQQATTNQLIILYGDTVNNTWVVVRVNQAILGATDSA